MAMVKGDGSEAGGTGAVARLVARVDGHVQGVGYRAFVVVRAEALGLAGWVRNLPTGEVDMEVEGPRPRLERFVRDLQNGPPASRVRHVHVEWAPARGLSGFEIKRI
jgi:acylphosphatase